MQITRNITLDGLNEATANTKLQIENKTLVVFFLKSNFRVLFCAVPLANEVFESRSSPLSEAIDAARLQHN